MPLLLDTGIIYALADADDAWHRRAAEFLASRREALLTTSTVVAEAAYLIRDRLGAAAELVFARSLASRELPVEEILPSDWKRAAELLHSHPFLGLVDATVCAVAERLKLKVIAT